MDLIQIEYVEDELFLASEIQVIQFLQKCKKEYHNECVNPWKDQRFLSMEHWVYDVNFVWTFLESVRCYQILKQSSV